MKKRYLLYCLMFAVVLSGLLYFTKAENVIAAENVLSASLRQSYDSGQEYKIAFNTASGATVEISSPFSIRNYNKAALFVYDDHRLNTNTTAEAVYKSGLIGNASGGGGVQSARIRLETAIAGRAINNASWTNHLVGSSTRTYVTDTVQLYSFIPSYGSYNVDLQGQKYARFVVEASAAVIGPTVWVRLYNE